MHEGVGGRSGYALPDRPPSRARSLSLSPARVPCPRASAHRGHSGLFSVRARFGQPSALSNFVDSKLTVRGHRCVWLRSDVRRLRG